MTINRVKSVVAVIMCVYKNDTLNNLKLAIESVLNQSGVISDIYVFVDGYVEGDVYFYLTECNKKPSVNVFFNENNVGLASGLNWILDNKIDFEHYKYIARMDADDISLPSRLEKQIDAMILNSASIVGTDCFEIDEDGKNIFYKKMQSEDEELKRNIIKRCPFIHPSVLFRSQVFKDGFRYNSSLMNTQDYYLWVELAYYGYKFFNLNEPLLLFRVDKSFHKRRGIKKSLNELRGRFYAMKKLKVMTLRNLFYTFSYFLLRMLPSNISALAYKYFR